MSSLMLSEVPPSGTVCLVFGCRLQLRPGWENCVPGLCKPRPCWIARWSGSVAAVFPFSTELWRSPVLFRRGEGGLRADCCLIPTLVDLASAKLGPVVGLLEREVVHAKLLCRGELARQWGPGVSPETAARRQIHEFVTDVCGFEDMA